MTLDRRHVRPRYSYTVSNSRPTIVLVIVFLLLDHVTRSKLSLPSPIVLGFTSNRRKLTSTLCCETASLDSGVARCCWNLSCQAGHWALQLSGEGDSHAQAAASSSSALRPTFRCRPHRRLYQRSSRTLPLDRAGGVVCFLSKL